MKAGKSVPSLAEFSHKGCATWKELHAGQVSIRQASKQYTHTEQSRTTTASESGQHVLGPRSSLPCGIYVKNN